MIDLCVLDCTLRDGGYYTSWEFDAETVRKYLAAMKDSGVDVVELGYRLTPTSLFLGPYAYCSEDFLSLLNLPNNLEYAVMVDESNVSNYHHGIDIFFSRYFVPKDVSVISIVRVAVREDRVENAKEICLKLQELGYKVCLNVMQIHRCTTQDIESIVAKVSSWECISTFYFADSLGSLRAEQVEKITHSISHKWSGNIGFHAHNNCNAALENAIRACGSGCNWVDVTVNGMGRGAGNAPTEMFLIELTKGENKFSHLNKLFDLVLNEFTQLKQKYEWGGGLLYQLAALYNVHPTYVQQMLAHTKYDTNSLLDGMKHLSENDGHIYSDEKLHEACSEKRQLEGASNLSKYFLGKKLLIIGPGKSVVEYKEILELKIKTQNLIVLSTNFDVCFDESCIDYYVSSNFLKNYSKIKNVSCGDFQFIMPKTSLSDSSIDACLLDYEITIQDGVFEIYDTYVKMPTDKSLLYALAVVIASNADEIYLAGFDGHLYDDIKFKEVNDALLLFEKHYGYDKIFSLTPTKYNIPHKTMFTSWN
jgi:4-hydroxy 2-oxovalerate aldolase